MEKKYLELAVLLSAISTLLFILLYILSPYLLSFIIGRNFDLCSETEYAKCKALQEQGYLIGCLGDLCGYLKSVMGLLAIMSGAITVIIFIFKTRSGSKRP
jgi:hypothetical protein